MSTSANRKMQNLKATGNKFIFSEKKQPNHILFDRASCKSRHCSSDFQDGWNVLALLASLYKCVFISSSGHMEHNNVSFKMCSLSSNSNKEAKEMKIPRGMQPSTFRFRIFLLLHRSHLRWGRASPWRAGSRNSPPSPKP